MVSESQVLGDYQELEEQEKMNCEMIASHIAAESAESQQEAPPQNTRAMGQLLEAVS